MPCTHSEMVCGPLISELKLNQTELMLTFLGLIILSRIMQKKADANDTR